MVAGFDSQFPSEIIMGSPNDILPLFSSQPEIRSDPSIVSLVWNIS
jgi:hypothetical protein